MAILSFFVKSEIASLPYVRLFCSVAVYEVVKIFASEETAQKAKTLLALRKIKKHK